MANHTPSPTFWQRLAEFFGSSNGAPPPIPKPTRGVPVELDHTRHLRYSMATIEAMRDDEELGDAILEGGDKVPLGDYVRGIWYGLRHEDPDLTIDDVKDLIDMQNVAPVTTKMVEALGMEVDEKDPTGATPTDREMDQQPSPAKST